MATTKSAAVKAPNLADLIAGTRATMQAEVAKLRERIADLQDQLLGIEEYGLPKSEYIVRFRASTEPTGARQGRARQSDAAESCEAQCYGQRSYGKATKNPVTGDATDFWTLWREA